MPRIPDRLSDAIVFVYENADAASARSKHGATAFLVGVPTTLYEGGCHVYLVTNSHVCVRGEVAVTLPLKAGGFDILTIPSSSWTEHFNGDDVAACLLRLGPHHRYAAVHADWLVTEADLVEQNIGLGDEIFFLGRYSEHAGDGGEPVVRFGSISMMPSVVRQKYREFDQLSYLLETRSVSGFSGSPVFIYVEPLSLRFPGGGFASELNNSVLTQFIGLLAVDWGHFEIDNDNLRHTGVTAAVPASKLVELLAADLLKDERRQIETSDMSNNQVAARVASSADVLTPSRKWLRYGR